MLLAAALPQEAFAQATWTSATNGTWGTAANWSTSIVPGAGNNTAAVLSATGGSYTVTYDAAMTGTLSSLTLTNVASNTTTLNVNAANFRFTSGTMTNATINLNSGGSLVVGTLSSATGLNVLNINGGSFSSSGAFGSIVSQAASILVNISSGTFTSTSNSYGRFIMTGGIANTSGAFDQVYGGVISGGTFTNTSSGNFSLRGTTTWNVKDAGVFNVGKLAFSGASSEVLQIDTGGVMTVTGDTFVLGSGTSLGSTRSSQFIQNGGSVSMSNVNGLVIGLSSGNTLIGMWQYQMQGGALALPKITLSGSLYTGSGTNAFRMSGGTLNLGSGGLISGGGSGTKLIQLSGGTVAAAADWVSSLDMSLLTNSGMTVVGTGTATFQAADSGNVARNIALSGVLSGSGALAKTGGGVLTLSNANTYTGATRVNEGVLKVDGSLSGSSAVTVGGASATGTPTLTGSGTVGGAVTLSDVTTVGRIDPGSVGGVGTLSVGSIAFGNGSVFRVDLGAGANNADTLAITNAATIASGAMISFNTLSTLEQGKYTLATAASGLNGNAFASTSTPSAYRLSQTGTEVALFARPVQAVGGLSALPSRVMQGQSIAFTGTVSNANPSGGDSLTLALAQLAGTDLSLSALTPSGTIAAGGGALQVSGTVATGSTLGARTWGVQNTDANATVATVGSSTATINVLDNRVVTAAPVNFGLVHVNAAASGSSAFSSSGADGSYTRITVGNGSGGGFTVTGDASYVFNGSGNSSRTLSGTFSTAGTVYGTIALTNASAESAGTLAGQSPGTTTLTYSASVFNGNGAWNGGSGAWGTNANWADSNGVAAAPGVFAGFTNTDTATFSGAGGTVSLDGATPSLKGISFAGASGNYTIARGSGGSLTLDNGASRAAIHAVSGTQTIAAIVSGTSGLEKTGLGKLVLSGTSSYSGGTGVTGGTLSVNGSIAGAVAIGAGAELGGSGSIGGSLSGAGLVGPGNSPGILTATSIDPTGGLKFAFEFTQASPDYASAFNSGNDVLGLTGSTPFLSALASANTVDIYFASNVVDLGTLTGGFFTANQVDFLSSISGATFRYFVQSNSGTYSYNGLSYQTLAQYDTSKTMSLSTVATNSGQVTQFVIVPEPGTIIFAGIGIVMAGCAAWNPRRIARILKRA